MQAAITIPYAIADYAILRERGYYYVDKTRYIPLLERYSAPARACLCPHWPIITM